MSENKIIQELVIFFESKLRSYTDTTLKVWELKLSPHGQNAIDALNWASEQPDDFPTVGKIIERIEAVKKQKQDAIWQMIGSYRKMFANLYVHWHDGEYEKALSYLTKDELKLWNDFGGKKFLQSEEKYGFMTSGFSSKVLEFANTERGLTNV